MTHGRNPVGRRLARGVARRLGLRRAAGAKGDPFVAYRFVEGPALVEVAAVAPAAAGEALGREAAGAAAARRLAVLVPSLMRDRLTGGPNTALQLGARVAARGVAVRFVATHGGVDDPGYLRDHVLGLLAAGATPDVRFEAAAGRDATLHVSRDELVMATWWPTAHLARRTLPVSGRADFLYLVQDVEPAFYPWSTNYALALETYGMPIRPIFNTGLLREHFLASGMGPAAWREERASTWFEPAVDTTLFRRRPRPAGAPRRLLFYARPGKPRNLFDLGLRALREAVRSGAFDGWTLQAIGEPIPELDLGGHATLRPTPWQSYADYAALLGDSDVLLSLMLSPHPSYPPLEMAAAGGLVVTNAFGVKTAGALRAISPRIQAVDPTVEALAAGLVDAARTAGASAAEAAAREATAPPQGGSPATERPATWDAALEPVVDWILATSF